MQHVCLSSLFVDLRGQRVRGQYDGWKRLSTSARFNAVQHESSEMGMALFVRLVIGWPQGAT